MRSGERETMFLSIMYLGNHRSIDGDRTREMFVSLRWDKGISGAVYRICAVRRDIKAQEYMLLVHGHEAWRIPTSRNLDFILCGRQQKLEMGKSAVYDLFINTP